MTHPSIKVLLLSSALILAGCAAETTPTSQDAPVTPAPAAQETAAKPVVDTDIAIVVMENLSHDSMEGRAAMTEGNRIARLYITEMVQNLMAGTPPETQSFTRSVTGRDGQTREVSGTNLIVALPGKMSGGPILEITAHYDHIGTNADGEVYNGADDNGSGVGALFSILKSFQESPPEHDVRLVWLDAEEMGLTGAREYVQTLDDRPRFNLNLDMIAQNEDGVIYGSGTYHTPALAPIVTAAAEGTGVTLKLGHDRPEDGPNDWTLQSDHAPFHLRGIPFLYLGVEDHPHYHQVTDTFDTIPLDVYMKTVRLSVNVAHLLDDNLSDLAKPAQPETATTEP
jgi:Zn-dependent M28 family amino/carboxypeptidase